MRQTPAPRPVHGIITLACGLLLAMAAISAPAQADEQPPAAPVPADGLYDSQVTEITQVTTRFGDRLTVELVFPAIDGQKAPGPFPVVACLCYILNVDGGTDLMAMPTGPSAYAQHGYVAATVRVAGSGTSEGGKWDLSNEKWQLMNYDAIEWLGTQPWSTGKVGTIGGSGNGMSQIFTSQQRPPHLTTMIPSVSGHDSWDSLQPGGMLSLQIAAFGCGIPGLATNTLNGIPVPPLNSSLDGLSINQLGYLLEMNLKKVATAQVIPYCPIIEGAWEHREKDDYWTGAMTSKVEDVDIPVMMWGGWDDIFDYAIPHTYTDLGSEQKALVMGLNSHGSPGGGDGYDATAESLRWFDHFLKGEANGVAEELATGGFRYYVDRAFVWKSAPEYPIPGTDYTDFHLGTDGTHPLADGTLSLSPTATTGADSYVYVPLLSMGGLLEMTYDLLNPLNPNNPKNDTFLNQNLTNGDQRLFTGPDTVTYVSEPLTEDMEVTGPLDATIFATTTAPDTDFVFKLIDVFPSDGSATSGAQPGFFQLVTSGNLKGTFRTYKDAFVEQTPIPTGEAVEYEIEGKPLSHQFKAGHRIAVVFSSSAAPRLMPNMSPAKVTIHHSSQYPSRVTLPIIGANAQSVELSAAEPTAAVPEPGAAPAEPNLIEEIQRLLQSGA